MRETTIARLRSNVKEYLDSVEKGDTVRVYRRGQPIAEIIPIPKKKPSWKREVPRLTVAGISLSREILKDRSRSS